MKIEMKNKNGTWTVEVRTSRNELVDWATTPNEIIARSFAEKFLQDYPGAEVAREYGVFAWERENMYRRSAAIKIFKIERAAQRYADRLNAIDPNVNAVVRTITF